MHKQSLVPRSPGLPADHELEKTDRLGRVDVPAGTVQLHEHKGSVLGGAVSCRADYGHDTAQRSVCFVSSVQPSARRDREPKGNAHAAQTIVDRQNQARFNLRKNQANPDLCLPNRRRKRLSLAMDAQATAARSVLLSDRRLPHVRAESKTIQRLLHRRTERFVLRAAPAVDPQPGRAGQPFR